MNSVDVKPSTFFFISIVAAIIESDTGETNKSDFYKLISMDYVDLIQRCRKFYDSKGEDGRYLKCLGENNPHEILKLWNYRRHYSESRLDKCINGNTDKLALLKNGRLLNTNISKFEKTISQLFDDFCDVAGSTGASKALHVLLPDLFVMWDSAIKSFYGCGDGDGHSYYGFLNDMQKELSDAIISYKKNNIGNDQKFIEEINKQVFQSATVVPLTRLLDAWNFSFRYRWRNVDVSMQY